MKRIGFVRTAVAAAIVAASAGSYAHFIKTGAGNGGAIAVPAIALSTTPAAPASPATTAGTAPAMPAQAANVVTGLASATDFSGIVDRYGPAVVNISVLGKAHRAAAGESAQLDPADPLSEFLRRFGQMPGQQPHGQRNTPLMRGQGSGFVISADGVILTNAHVVEGADEMTVKLTDRREFKAKVLGVDKQTDIAVIRIDARNLPVVKFGDPAAAKVGEPVLAIGSPYGFENTATAGIISAKSRSLPDDTYVPFIQTDVAVNPGNSGGPLFNLRGEVIGINSQIYSQTGGYQGLSFAIPINVATRIKDELVQNGKVSRGRIGVSVQEITQALSESFGLKDLRGALVSEVEKDGPAARAGLKSGDVIVKLDGQAVASSSDLPSLVASIKPGSAARIEVLRNGESRSFTVTIGKMKDASLAAASDGAREQGRLGLAVRPLEKQESGQLGVSGGLLVEDAGGPAARSGIQPGDVILSMNGVSVNSAEQLKALASKAGKHVALLVQRDAAKIFIPIDFG
ncbi:MAG: DegQ family serine endoprotease [Janthinobacterium lividum]